jgi:hypothetical protein
VIPVRALLLVVPLLLACGRGERAAPRPAPPALDLVDVRLLGPGADERLAPSFGRGEPLALAFTPRPAVPPITAVIRVLRPSGGVVAELPPAPATRQGGGPSATWVVPIALPAAAPAGAYRVEALVTDARGRRAAATERLELVADPPGAASAPAAAPGSATGAGITGLVLRDAAGQPRTHYARGERATLAATVGGTKPGDVVRVELRGAEGLYAATERPAGAPERLELTVLVPPFGPAGSYRVGAALLRGGAAVATTAVPLVVVGRPLAAPSRLTVEASTVAGTGRRRVAEVRPPAAPLVVRVAGFTVRPAPGGWAVALAGRATLRSPDGQPVAAPAALAPLRETVAYRPLRLELTGELDLRRVRPGDYLLELEVTDEPTGRHATQLRHLVVP